METMCIDCSQPTPKPKRGRRLYCESCNRQRQLELKRISAKNWRNLNKEEDSKRRKEKYRLTEATPEQKAVRSQKAKDRTKFLKQSIFNHYGQSCLCCGEKRIEFLSIDHINGGGNKHRKEIGSNLAFYSWIVRNHFPDFLRILCFNCNQARGFYGYCPHEKENLE